MPRIVPRPSWTTAVAGNPKSSRSMENVGVAWESALRNAKRHLHDDSSRFVSRAGVNYVSWYLLVISTALYYLKRRKKIKRWVHAWKDAFRRRCVASLYLIMEILELELAECGTRRVFNPLPYDSLLSRSSAWYVMSDGSIMYNLDLLNTFEELKLIIQIYIPQRYTGL